MFDNLGDAPEGAAARLVAVARSIEQNQPAGFLELVSSGGFAAGTLALNAEQVETELQVRSVAELSGIRCDAAAGCRWQVEWVTSSRLAVAARSAAGPAGSIELMLDDDGTWKVVRAPASSRP